MHKGLPLSSCINTWGTKATMEGCICKWTSRMDDFHVSRGMAHHILKCAFMGWTVGTKIQRLINYIKKVNPNSTVEQFFSVWFSHNRKIYVSIKITLKYVQFTATRCLYFFLKLPVKKRELNRANMRVSNFNRPSIDSHNTLW